jgi:hypothetical protein
VGVLVFGWLRLLRWIGVSTRSSLLPSLGLALVSWVAIIQVIAFIFSSPLLTVAALLAFVVAGLIGPGAFLVRLARPFLSRR